MTKMIFQEPKLAPNDNVSLPVDIAYAFDYLSILEVKVKHIGGDKISNNFTIVEESLIAQLGKFQYFEIKNSEEYKNLFDINQMVFRAVDKAKLNEVSAKYVDSLNVERYNIKRKLQKKFFPKFQFSEVKKI